MPKYENKLVELYRIYKKYESQIEKMFPKIHFLYIEKFKELKEDNQNIVTVYLKYKDV